MCAPAARSARSQFGKRVRAPATMRSSVSFLLVLSWLAAAQAWHTNALVVLIACAAAHPTPHGRELILNDQDDQLLRHGNRHTRRSRLAEAVDMEAEPEAIIRNADGSSEPAQVRLSHQHASKPLFRSRAGTPKNIYGTLDALSQQLDAMWLERVATKISDGEGSDCFIVENDAGSGWFSSAVTYMGKALSKVHSVLQKPGVQVAVGVGIAVFAVVLVANPVGATAVGVAGVAWGTYNLMSKLVSRYRTYKKSGHSNSDRAMFAAGVLLDVTCLGVGVLTAGVLEPNALLGAVEAVGGVVSGQAGNIANTIGAAVAAFGLTEATYNALWKECFDAYMNDDITHKVNFGGETPLCSDVFQISISPNIDIQQMAEDGKGSIFIGGTEHVVANMYCDQKESWCTATKEAVKAEEDTLRALMAEQMCKVQKKDLVMLTDPQAYSTWKSNCAKAKDSPGLPKPKLKKMGAKVLG